MYSSVYYMLVCAIKDLLKESAEDNQQLDIRDCTSNILHMNYVLRSPELVMGAKLSD